MYSPQSSQQPHVFSTMQSTTTRILHNAVNNHTYSPQCIQQPHVFSTLQSLWMLSVFYYLCLLCCTISYLTTKFFYTLYTYIPDTDKNDRTTKSTTIIITSPWWYNMWMPVTQNLIQCPWNAVLINLNTNHIMSDEDKYFVKWIFSHIIFSQKWIIINHIVPSEDITTCWTSGRRQVFVYLDETILYELQHYTTITAVTSMYGGFNGAEAEDISDAIIEMK